ncbi:MAG: aldehyde dehydrogenase family protein [Planctomycetota bacterium]
MAGDARGNTWPRSGEADALLALKAAARAAPGWWAHRAHVLERAVEALVSDPDPGASVATTLGLEPAELAASQADLADVLRLALRAGADARGELAIVAPHWSGLVRDSAQSVLRALASGACVIAVSDPALPMAMQAVAGALAHADLPAGAFALVHDDGETTLAALLEHATGGVFVGSGTQDRVRRMRVLAERNVALRTELVEHCNRTAVVRQEDDVRSAAHRIAHAAFGRAGALSGQAPGQVGRVACHERAFSSFTAELLAHFDADTTPAIPMRAAATLLHGARARDLGLDEGATLLRSGAAGGVLPIVFTNVEEYMRLAALSRPAPILCLMRATSDAAAEELRERLDHSPAAEDLAAE